MSRQQLVVRNEDLSTAVNLRTARERKGGAVLAPLTQRSRERTAPPSARSIYKNAPARRALLYFLPRRGKKHNPPEGRT